MTEPRPFGVETVELDLPPLAAAFGRRLREAGLPITPERPAAFAEALTLVRPISRRRLYWTARGVFVSDRTQAGAFDAVFDEVFGDGRQGELPDDAPLTRVGPDERRETGSARPGDGEPDERGHTTAAARGDGPGTDDAPEIPVPLAMASDEERLAGRSFEALEPHELAQVQRLMTGLRLATPLRRTRRHEESRHGRRVDLRRTLRASLHTEGQPLRLARRERRLQPRRLVLLCDISGSMEPYARAYLQFLAAAGSGPHAEAFVFATRLTRVTRALQARNPDRAIQRAAATAPDWSSGTRIGDALKAFTDRHGRRGMARGAVVVILSDGWERGDPQLVGREMERLARLAHRIVWVNPRLSGREFSVQAGGMRAALPHCDALVSGHSFEALKEVVAAIGAASWEAPGAEPPEQDEEEPWASATPEPGSSVAMPSGYGPKRGKTTPGWLTGG